MNYAREHIDVLAKNYTGKEHINPRSSDEVRVTFKMLPERVTGTEKWWLVLEEGVKETLNPEQ